MQVSVLVMVPGESEGDIGCGDDSSDGDDCE